MRLKIEKIQKLTKDILYGDRIFDRDLFLKGENDIYTWINPNIDLVLYQTQAIVDNIIPNYLNSVHNQSFENLYEFQPYDSIEDKRYGLHLGIAFYKLPHAEIIFNEWFSDNTKSLNRYKSEAARIEQEVLMLAQWEFIPNSLEAKRNYLKGLNERIASLSDTLDGSNCMKQLIFKQYETRANQFESAQQEKIEKANNYRRAYIENHAVAEFLGFILNDSFYPFEFDCRPRIEYSEESKLLIVDYYLPTIDEIPNIKEIKIYKTKRDEIKYLSKTELNRLYDELIYKILIRSIAEIFHFDDLKKVDTVCFNGRVGSRNPATGQLMDNCILSVQINRQEFETIDLNYVDCKACFKHFKGVSGAKLHDQSPVVPLIQLDTTDKRFIESHHVTTDETTNLATMEWGEFEHLVRELFDLEFNVNGGEVKITQASRDGGVDAVAFDPDPIRGGKIVIQAKRYTNTVGVSAVRDLYGTVINEGANKGILITTSDYGADSYNFAKGKPITLLNGGHLLFLLEKHNKKARIDLKEAK